jgi:hypothetical protein
MIEQWFDKNSIEYKTNRFFSGKAVKAPAVASPAPIPVVGSDVEDYAMKEARSASNFAKTKITGNLVPMSKGLKTTLG